ncbi:MULTISPECIES: HWE histidine kinase domain-containing protein [unclassified Rhizobium]|uniref:HWE histidine kinase domain-containing protein n=1 Tax=unclassified Rhizobium TaxID=2613769 RepID=UPI000701B043|nr:MULTISPECIES: HWE histidine kinase domain-containing protein [unclassified Rhizobium]KQV40002.1 hypothetical protein ASC86_22460 [Rhizobium sp. Root1212]KRD31713.1 hypothetical protein ASE37_23510 [Rhizobium sp. Root268]
MSNAEEKIPPQLSEYEAVVVGGRVVLDAIPGAIYVRDHEGFLVSNAEAARLWGRRPSLQAPRDRFAAEVVGKPITILIPTERQDEEPQILARICRGDHIEHYETVRRRKDGSQIDVSLTVSPLKNSKGQIVGASKIARDITERRQEERPWQLLINELNHRVENTLATVQSLASQTFRGERDSQTFERFESRLVALARAHDLLTQESWEGADIGAILNRSFQAVCPEPEARLQASGPPCRLKPKLALSQSMAFHELGTNAVKHGALSTDSGKIAVHRNLGGSERDRRLSLTWGELGGPAVATPEKRGFGSRLLEQALARELDAQAALSFTTLGIVFTLDAPLPDINSGKRNEYI